MCFGCQTGWVTWALKDRQLHFTQVDTLLDFKSYDVDSSYDSAMVENENFRIRCDVELKFFRTHNAVETLPTPWLNFSQNLPSDVVVDHIAFYLQKWYKDSVCSVKCSYLSCATLVRLLEVKMTDISHKKILVLLLKLLNLEHVRVLNYTEHASVLKVKKSEGLHWCEMLLVTTIEREHKWLQLVSIDR